MFFYTHYETGVVDRKPTQTGRMEIAKILLDLGLDPNIQGGRLFTALKAASFSGAA